MQYLWIALAAFGSSTVVTLLLNWFLFIRPEDRRLGIERPFLEAVRHGFK